MWSANAWLRGLTHARSLGNVGTGGLVWMSKCVDKFFFGVDLNLWW